ncbi:MAG: hypothetical protein JWM44_3608 [Bacilli bacterium]|nr:hypothetical protein [Bacilli bacterium]
MTHLLQDENLEGAEKRIGAFVKMLTNSHLENDWSYNFEFNKDGVTITEKPQDISMLDRIEKKIEIKMVIPDKFKNFKSFNEIIVYGKNKQIPLEIELIDLKFFAGARLVEHHKSEFEKNLVIIIPPDPFPILKGNFIFGDDLFQSKIWMQITEKIDDQTIELSNKNQPDKEIYYRFTFNLKEQVSSDFKLSIPIEKEKNVSSSLLYNKIIFYSKESLELKVLIEGNSERAFFTTEIRGGLKEDNSKLIRILEVLKKIEETFNIVFILPDLIQSEEIKLITELESIVSYKKIENDFNEYSIEIADISLLKDLMLKANNNEPISFIGEGDSFYNLFGYKLEVDVNITLPPTTIKDKDIIQKKLEVLTQGDSLLVTLIPFDNINCLTTYIYSNFRSSEII